MEKVTKETELKIVTENRTGMLAEVTGLLAVKRISICVATPGAELDWRKKTTPDASRETSGVVIIANTQNRFICRPADQPYFFSVLNAAGRAIMAVSSSTVTKPSLSVSRALNCLSAWALIFSGLTLPLPPVSMSLKTLLR